MLPLSHDVCPPCFIVFSVMDIPRLPPSSVSTKFTVTVVLVHVLLRNYVRISLYLAVGLLVTEFASLKFFPLAF